MCFPLKCDSGACCSVVTALCAAVERQPHQAFHVNPLNWAFRAAVLNEFQSPAYDVCLPEVAEGQECPQENKLGQVL